VEKWRCANIFLKYLEVFASAELNLKIFHWIGYDYFQKSGFFVQALNIMNRVPRAYFTSGAADAPPFL